MRTRVGYTGGTRPHPTYHRLGDHSEALQIDYDPTRIGYAELLEHFWCGHLPTSEPYSRQYRAAVFCHDEAQRRLAQTTKNELAAQKKRPITTAIEPLGTFYRAEDYHQKYYLRRHTDLVREFAGYSDEAFTDSTVAARLNGYLRARAVSPAEWAALGRSGLSAHALERLGALLGRSS